MLLLNAGDEGLEGMFSIDPPEIGGGTEIYVPPKRFTFPPGQVVDMRSEAAGQHFHNLFSGRGLVMVEVGDDLAAARKRGRRRLYDHYAGVVNEFLTRNQASVHAGIPPSLPSQAVLQAKAKAEALQKEFLDEIVAMPVLDPALAGVGPNAHMSQLVVAGAILGARGEHEAAKAGGTSG